MFGTGLGSICVTQNTISNTYFKDYDLATAFAATLTVSRIGSVLNFFLSTYIYTWFGSRLNAVFWWGTCMTFVSVVAAFLFFFLDRYVEREGILVSGKIKNKITSLFYINQFILSYNSFFTYNLNYKQKILHYYSHLLLLLLFCSHP